MVDTSMHSTQHGSAASQAQARALLITTVFTRALCEELGYLPRLGTMVCRLAAPNARVFPRCSTLGELASQTRERLLISHRFGERTVDLIEVVLARYGLALAQADEGRTVH